jgi:6-pyruvoyltetrahydropterin/6-carboxytetrahydropterin synthase
MKVFEVRVQGRFSAAHNLTGYQGDCERLHGHNWVVEVAVTGRRGENGMVVDFRVLKETLSRVLAALDHRYLNELECFKKQNTTTENIAQYIFGEVSSALPKGLKVCAVTTWESPDSAVTYRPGDNEPDNSGKEDNK